MLIDIVVFVAKRTHNFSYHSDYKTNTWKGENMATDLPLNLLNYSNKSPN